MIPSDPGAEWWFDFCRIFLISCLEGNISNNLLSFSVNTGANSFNKIFWLLSSNLNSFSSKSATSFVINSEHFLCPFIVPSGVERVVIAAL